MTYQDYELSFYEESVGSYGRKWLVFMHQNHPELVKQMTEDNSLLDVARSVDERAWEYNELLAKQYLTTHPYPNKFEENVKYHTTKDFYISGAVMREIVLIPHTTF
jgi:hypothetical protein